MTVRDASDEVVASGESILAVINTPATSQPFRLMAIGDSLTAPGRYQAQLAQRLSDASIVYETLGTVTNNGFNYEGYGGNTYERYLEGPHYFRSPFVYSDTEFDPERYFAENTAGVTPTLYLVFLGINDTFSGSNGTEAQQETRLDEVMSRAVAFIDGMRAAAPGSDVGIVLTPAASADQAAYDAAYGEGVYTAEKWHGMRLKLISRYSETFGNRENEGIFLVPLSTGLDRIKDYTTADPIHPKTSGYEKIGDMIFSWLSVYLQDHAYPRWALGNLSRALVLVGEADPDDNPDGDPYDNRVEHIFNMDPIECSPSPLKLSSAGLRTTYLQGAEVILESTTTLSNWDPWEGPVQETSEDGYVDLQVPFESLTNQFFRLRY
jgi:lysophospholipase L1-like esterase